MRFCILFFSLPSYIRSISLFQWGSFPYVVPSVASQPSICTTQGNPLDACPIKTLLEVVERAMSYENTIQVIFLINAASSVGVVH